MRKKKKGINIPCLSSTNLKSNYQLQFIDRVNRKITREF